MTKRECGSEGGCGVYGGRWETRVKEWREEQRMGGGEGWARVAEGKEGGGSMYRASCQGPMIPANQQLVLST